MDATWQDQPQSTRRIGVEIETVLLGIIVLSLAVKLHLVFARQINWDEFYYLSFVHRYGEGTLSLALQTLHVHFFQWLDRLGANEVSQIVAARLVMYALSLGTTWLVYSIARRFLDRPASLAAVACYAGFNLVLVHGASFRTDPLATFLLMASLRLVMAHKGRPAALAIAGGSAAIAVLVTVKSVFYAPTLVVLLALCAPRGSSFVRRIADAALFTLCAGASIALLYGMHKSALAVPPVAASDGAHLAGAYKKTIFDAGFFPQFDTFWRTVLGNGLVWPAIAAGGLIALRNLLRAQDGGRVRWLALGALAAPVTSLLFYRNGFPYFYPMILAPASVLAGLTAETLLEPGGRRWATSLMRAGLVTLPATVLLTYAVALGTGLSDQRRVLEVVHRAFPEPVAYIDRCSMVSGFPKAGFFMSSWGMENYLAGGRPRMREIILRDQPAFLLANVVYLEEAFADLGDAERPPILFPDDIDALRENFIPHWGPIYVAGKHLRREGAASRTFEILIEGTYTLEAAAAVLIDGRMVRPGAQVSLNRGRHKVQASAPANDIVLRWGESLFRPDETAPDGPVFRGF